jgi:bifunctional non-homologous end joining protein LigD
MPLLRRKAPPGPPAQPADWRPQRFGGRNFRTVRDPIIEPHWDGRRVLAHLVTGSVNLIDEDAVDCTADFEDVAAAIGAAATADELVLDGYLTIQPTQASTGVGRPTVEAPSGGQMMTQLVVGTRHYRDEPAAPERKLDHDRPAAFMAVDLLSIDGTPLIDLPLLERKRLLDGAIEPTELVRVTPFVRPPAGSFLATWQASGLNRLAYKGVNSRYRPGERNEEWASVTMPSRAPR